MQRTLHEMVFLNRSKLSREVELEAHYGLHGKDSEVLHAESSSTDTIEIGMTFHNEEVEILRKNAFEHSLFKALGHQAPFIIVSKSTSDRQQISLGLHGGDVCSTSVLGLVSSSE
ncbi:hypothetical protein Tco_0726439 [Tanacetum coccineum]|uniref:Uncharacterized protein n=1 Tax=Tanacetum coccineum TaxID=301880 RepID=A0ABQ4YFK9_9ASTR